MWGRAKGDKKYMYWDGEAEERRKKETKWGKCTCIILHPQYTNSIWSIYFICCPCRQHWFSGPWYETLRIPLFYSFILFHHFCLLLLTHLTLLDSALVRFISFICVCSIFRFGVCVCVCVSLVIFSAFVHACDFGSVVSFSVFCFLFAFRFHRLCLLLPLFYFGFILLYIFVFFLQFFFTKSSLYAPIRATQHTWNSYMCLRVCVSRQ